MSNDTETEVVLNIIKKSPHPSDFNDFHSLCSQNN